MKLHVYRDMLDQLTEQEWQALRYHGIGGSDAGVMMHDNPYKTKRQLYEERYNNIHVDLSHEVAIKKGRDLEDLILDKFVKQTGKVCYKPNEMYYHPDFPHMKANLDGIIHAENALAEFKFITYQGEGGWLNANGEWTAPKYYYAQCQHYMFVTGAEKTYLCGLLESQWELVIIEIPRDEEYIMNLKIEEFKFWNRLQDGIPPDEIFTANELTDEELRSIQEKSHEVDPLVDELAYERLANKETIKELEKRNKEITSQILNLRIEGKEGEEMRPRVAVQKRQNRKVDYALFMEKYPEIYNELVEEKIAETKVLRIYKQKKEGN